MHQARYRAVRALEADGWDAELGSSSGSSAGRGGERQRRLRCPARRGVGAACTAWVAGSTELPDPPKASGCPGPHVYPAPSVWHEARAAAGSAASDCWRHLLDGRCIDTSKIHELTLGRAGRGVTVGDLGQRLNSHSCKYEFNELSQVSLAWRPHKKTGAPSPETRGLGCCHGSSSSLYATRKYSISQQPECGPARAGGFYLKIKSKVSLYH